VERLYAPPLERLYAPPCSSQTPYCTYRLEPVIYCMERAGFRVYSDMNRSKQDIGRALATRQQHKTWVQTERASHEAWAQLIAVAPMAARLAHVLVAHMGDGNAVVASQATLGELMSLPGQVPVHRHTVRKAIKRLEADRWVEVVQIGGKGGALAYVINDRVAWGQPREKLRYSRFSAQVIASESEQQQPLNDRPPLRQIPTLMRGETQIPHGESAEPPSQGLLDGTEPDLPYRDPDTDDMFDPSGGENDD